VSAPARRRPRDGVATRARIEREALRLFAEKGFHGATIKDIATAVGVADAALYRYFPSKDAIARDIFTRRYAHLAEAIREIGRREAPLREILGELVDLLCDLMDREPDVFSFILLNQHAQLQFVGAGGNAVEELKLVMQAARVRGEISMEPDLAAAVALGAVLQPAVFKLYGRLPGPLAARAAILSDAAAAAIGAR
jgi:AcrR family transcriptional regulator